MTRTAAYAKHHRNLATALLLLVTVALFGPSVFFRHLFLDLQTVEVSQSLDVTAHRTIRRDFYGSFSVAIRDADTYRVVCIGGPAKPDKFWYRKRAGQANPVTYSLWQWAGLESRIAVCEANGFAPGGAYYLDTCHKAYTPTLGVLIGQRCVRSGLFTVPE